MAPENNYYYTIINTFFEPWLRHACEGRAFIDENFPSKWVLVFPFGIFPHSLNLGVSEIFRSPT